MKYYNYQVFHFLYLLLFFTFLFVLSLIKKKVKWEHFKTIIFIIASIPALINVFDFAYYLIIQGKECDLLNSLPLYLCDINSVVILFVILLDKEWLNHYLRWCIIPFTFFAIIFPDIQNGISNVYDYSIICFFITHSITVAVGIVISSRYKVNNIRSSWIGFIFLIFITLLSYLFTFLSVRKDYILNYAYLLYPPNFLMEIVYKMIPIPVLYMLVIYFLFFIIYISVLKVNELIHKGGFNMKKKIIIEYILSILVFASVIVSSILVCNFTLSTYSKKEESSYQQNLNYSFDINEELNLNNYTSVKLKKINAPNIQFEAEIEYISSASNSSVFYKIVDNQYPLGHHFYSGDFVGENVDGEKIYAEKEMIILDIEEDGFTCFFGYEELMYSYVPLDQLEYIQNALYKGVISTKGKFYNVTIDRIDTSKIYKNCVYVEYSMNSFDDNGYYGLSRFVCFDEYGEEFGVEKNIIYTFWKENQVVACYVLVDNKLLQLYLRIGKIDEIYYVFDRAFTYDSCLSEQVILLKTIDEIYIPYAK